MSYIFEYIGTETLDDNIKIVSFKCERFTYFARFLNDILQLVKAEKSDSYMGWPVPPTEEEENDHAHRREVFNQDHTIIQNWYNSL